MHYQFFFFQAEDGIRVAQESRGLGDVYKRQPGGKTDVLVCQSGNYWQQQDASQQAPMQRQGTKHCLLYTSDAADDLLCVDLGGRRIIKKQKN